jgi:hypothetical protein
MTPSTRGSLISSWTSLRATTKGAFGLALLGFVIVVSTMSLAGFFSQDSFYCELLSHLRLIYIPSLTACALVALATRRGLIAAPGSGGKSWNRR